MSVYSNIVLRDVDEIDVVKLKVATATVLAKGDLIDYSSGTAAAIVHSGDNSIFLGVAMEGSESGSVAEISIATRCKILIQIVSGDTDGTPGAAYKYNAGANGTIWTVAIATAEGIMWALEPITAGSAGLFRVDVQALAGGFLFDTCTEG